MAVMRHRLSKLHVVAVSLLVTIVQLLRCIGPCLVQSPLPHSRAGTSKQPVLAANTLKRSPRFWLRSRVALHATEAELRSEINGLRAKEIKSELETLGVSTANAFDKEELVERLVAARLAGPSSAPSESPGKASDDQSIPGLIYQRALTGNANEVKALTQEILKVSLNLAETDFEGQAWCARPGNYAGGYTSYGTERGRTLHRSEAAFEKLERFLASHSKAFLAQMDDAELQNPELKWGLQDCWVNVMGQGTEHAAHEHPGSFISGTFYVQTPPDCAGISFEDPQIGPEEVEYPVQAGEVILFPSWMRHRVPQNFADDDRISVSFNYKIDREIGRAHV